MYSNYCIFQSSLFKAFLPILIDCEIFTFYPLIAFFAVIFCAINEQGHFSTHVVRSLLTAHCIYLRTLSGVRWCSVCECSFDALRHLNSYLYVYSDNTGTQCASLSTWKNLEIWEQNKKNWTIFFLFSTI